MTYQEVINLFETISIQCGNFFVHGKVPDVNFFTINAEWPLVILPPFKEETDYNKANIETRIILFFFNQDNPSYTISERFPLINDQYLRKETFFETLLNEFQNPASPYFGLSISKVIATPEYAQMAGYVSGYSASFTLKSKIKCS